ncbi:MAG: hypothetical protein J7619_00745 [Dyadobacter sp.]|uniref:hypothetical protein n=1 Tax=Dyadobacter sp. TaxID=1914288 RepID=UPI001B1DD699|nr:hypothetical protein [Dyadobacter sp.]MBO9611184.1 hypothetical protein [Dyadobacter sp.]
MKTADHLSDMEIQQYALDTGSADNASHIAQCPHCSGRVAFYQKMVGSISAMPAEEFDFDLAKVVLTRLPSRKRRYAPELVFLACVSLAGILATIGVFCYLNTGLLRELLWNSKVIMGGVAGCLLFSFLLTNLWKDYSDKIRALNAAERLQHFPGAAV